MRRSAAEHDVGIAAAFSGALKALGFSPADRAAIAVSGGGDSIALMHLAADWSKTTGAVPPVVLTVDHGLRPQSPSHAAHTINSAEVLGLKAAVLVWEGLKPATGIEEQARLARYRLLGRWCADHRIHNLFLGHTRDDQAETFLLRLARGSGIDGLAGMMPITPLPIAQYSSVRVVRPLLDFSRDQLREYLRQRGAVWLEDEMNDDRAHARVRIRQLMPAIAAAGLAPQRIADATKHIGRARLALEAGARDFLQEHVRFCVSESSAPPDALLDGEVFRLIPGEIGLRVLSAILLRVGGGTYRPRFERLERLYRAITETGFRGQTLAGCRISKAPRSRQFYGRGTVLVRAEAARKSRRRPQPAGGG
jgi:tRNA(Ile)-lysidine synthase